MERLSFLKKDRAKLTIEALYSRCDLILVPNEQLVNWLIVGEDVNPEIIKQAKKQHDEVLTKLTHFYRIGLHRKKTNHFWMGNNNEISMWRLTPNGRSYEVVLIAQMKQVDSHREFYSIKLDKEKFIQVANLSGSADVTLFHEIAKTVLKYHTAFLVYYALNPFIYYIDATTYVNTSKGGTLIRRKREPNVIPLTMNHHIRKIKKGINVLNTETGQLYPSIRETSRQLEYSYSTLWFLLKDNEIPPFKRIEKLQVVSQICNVTKTG